MIIDFRSIAHGSAEWKEAVILRENILRKPLGSSFSAEELQEEQNHIQIVGFDGKKVIATAVLVPEGSDLKMQRVVVQEEYRNSDIGSKMMLYCEQLALDKNFKTMYCHARDTAVNFYSMNNYSKEGDYFDEDGIPHLKMYKHLTS